MTEAEIREMKRELDVLKRETGADIELYLPGDETSDCCRHKHRDSTEYEALLKRLKRIEGQVRGVQGMVEKDAYCTDILTQVSAIQSALNAFSKELLANHIRTCVVKDLREDRLDTVDELVSTIQRMMK